VSSHDLVVSLVPAPCHPDVAKAAIRHHKHMVTASYTSPEMKELHEAAVAAGITILNEAGLDPGIDHMVRGEGRGGGGGGGGPPLVL